MLYYRLMAVWRYSFLCTGLVLGVIRTPCANRAFQCPVRILPHKKTHPGDEFGAHSRYGRAVVLRGPSDYVQLIVMTGGAIN